ncbi:MAG TPA: hypothetical protein VFS09_06475 [Candidatus Eisenbacteria bacterium]|nr:hypothetical protein [Candidatus Eisenbacteria bacterium]
MNAGLPPGARVVPIEPDPRVGVRLGPDPWTVVKLGGSTSPNVLRRNRIAEMGPILPPGAQRVGAGFILPAGFELEIVEPSPVTLFDAWAAEGAQDRPPPGRRPWGARWER